MNDKLSKYIRCFWKEMVMDIVEIIIVLKFFVFFYFLNFIWILVILIICVLEYDKMVLKCCEMMYFSFMLWW